MQADEVKSYATRLSDVARQLNTFATSLKSQRKDNRPQTKSVRESTAKYLIEDFFDDLNPLFTDIEINWLEHSH